MVKQRGEEIFQGEIGQNIPSSKGEREEDILEMLYEWYGRGCTLTSADVCGEIDMTRREFNYYVRQMIKHGYLENVEPKADMPLILTEFGKTQGAECLIRHQRLTQFFQLIGLDEQQAEEDTCRVEHVISEKAVKGICSFLNYGDTYDRIIRNTNLFSIYEQGDYEFRMGIYCADKRYPRILAKEFYDFSDRVLLESRRERSFFYLCPLKADFSGVLWYREEEKWVRAEAAEKGFQIPTNVFSFTICTDDPVTEGDSIIALTQGDVAPTEEDYRELNIHIWEEAKKGSGLCKKERI